MGLLYLYFLPVVGWIRNVVLAERAAVVYSLVLCSENESYSLVRNFNTLCQNTELHIEKNSPEIVISVCQRNELNVHNHTTM